VKKIYLSIAALAALWALVCAGVATATVINYTATDLVDINPGQDLWQYSYTVSDYTFSADTGFTIYFDPTHYTQLDPFPVVPNADWDILTWNPDPNLPGDGAYDAYALVDAASLADPFIVSFAWSGGGAGPGAQFFEIYDGSTWTVIENGFTSGATPVPEPATTLLFSIGLTVFFGTVVRKRSNSNKNR